MERKILCLEDGVPAARLENEIVGVTIPILSSWPSTPPAEGTAFLWFDDDVGKLRLMLPGDGGCLQFDAEGQSPQ